MDNDKKELIMMTDLISLQQASLESGLSRSHLALLARKGNIKAWKFGNTWLTTRESVFDYLKLDKKPGPVKKT